ncbi:MAG: hypothetical protein HKO59_06335 [Phycisphaerales bacterium]|nr:hypothetical protein [Phycisphaerae bacterium]NNF42571.1 hypothetical protein [Phycisphaerales bacterium]NNM25592.1 hypothetical protein [Phycisphaerales bacterium]
MTDGVREPDPTRLLPIVVGAHLEAEWRDRPIAADLAAALTPALGRDCPLTPLVVSDLWYLNDQPLRVQPAITLGHPEVNAVTAYLATRVPTALLVEERFRVQLDPELIDLHVCLWGADPAGTAAAVDCFHERHLADYAAAVRLLAVEIA